VPIKIIIADDHPLCLSGLKKMLDIPDFELIGEANNGEELIQLSGKLKPDIIITDIKMPRMNGIEATKEIIKQLPHIGVIAISIVNEYNFIMGMLEAGAKGYLLKSVRPDEIIAAVKAVYNGEVYYCKETTSHMVNMLTQSVYRENQEDAKSEFSKLEIGIIRLVCQGRSNKEIARDLAIKKRTIEWHRQEIMHKLHVRNSAGMVAFAIKNNIC
jgi:DNA-binding NarL/FixJ family response regulator